MKGSIAGLFAALLTVASLFALAGYQVTSEGPATRLLGRLGAALIEIDRWLPAHKDDIELLARDKPRASVPLNDLPIAIELPSSAVLEAEDTQLRTLIVRTMGDAFYREGTGVFVDAEGRPRKPGVDEPARWAIALLGDGMHRLWEAALPLCLLLLLASTAGVLAGSKSPVVPIAAGAAFAAALSGGVWLLTSAAKDVSTAPVDREIMLALRDGAWIGLRNALAVAVVFIGMNVLFNSMVRQRQESWPTLPPDADSPFA